MTYTLHILRDAQKEMNRLPATTHARVSRLILSLEINPRPSGARKLRGRQEYRLRLGDYRLLYTVDDANGLVIVSAVGHRREVYR
ncbi:MAG: type II toxin-antitoxin system RelE/ParE family toxin [Chloroflexi bacterium]|nr:type II toxin-antitoxin system RelE/ParE family toxin [Chloroflexota bacterium]